MALFGKREDEPGAPMPNAQPQQTPIDFIMQMKSQGMTNNQIIQNLQGQGYSSDQIFEAMNQAEASSGVDNVAAGPIMQQAQPEPQQQEIQQEQVPPPVQQSLPEDADFSERIEEVAEAIIDEKWKELSKNIHQITEWKEQTESRITQMSEDFKTLKNDFNSLHSAILGKVGEYDHNIVNLGTEIKAMEKVFQKLLPTFAENVNELTEITKELKKKK